MRKITIALAALVTVLSAATTTPASASAGQIHPTTSASSICAQKGSGSCIQENSSNLNALIETKPFSSNGHQKWFGVVDNICNGTDKVTGTCPFAVGSGLNAQFKGDDIAIFQDSVGRCLGVSTDKTFRTIVQDCSGQTANGTIWILDGFSVINRWASDNTGPTYFPMYLTSQGHDGLAAYVTNPFQSGLSQWHQR